MNYVQNLSMNIWSLGLDTSRVLDAHAYPSCLWHYFGHPGYRLEIEFCDEAYLNQQLIHPYYLIFNLFVEVKQPHYIQRIIFLLYFPGL